jgi:hypothetical protein
MNVRHPVWCDRARCSVTGPNRGAHRSAWQVVQPREGDPFEVRVSVAERADAPGWPDVAVMHVAGYHDAGEDAPSVEPTDVLVLSLRQAFLTARAVDSVLLAVWFPEDARPAGLGVFAGRDDAVTGEPVPPHVEGIPVRRPDSPEGGERS